MTLVELLLTDATGKETKLALRPGLNWIGGPGATGAVCTEAVNLLSRALGGMLVELPHLLSGMTFQAPDGIFYHLRAYRQQDAVVLFRFDQAAGAFQPIAQTPDAVEAVLHPLLNIQQFTEIQGLMVQAAELAPGGTASAAATTSVPPPHAAPAPPQFNIPDDYEAREARREELGRLRERLAGEIQEMEHLAQREAQLRSSGAMELPKPVEQLLAEHETRRESHERDAQRIQRELAETDMAIDDFQKAPLWKNRFFLPTLVPGLGLFGLAIAADGFVKFLGLLNILLLGMTTWTLWNWLGGYEDLRRLLRKQRAAQDHQGKAEGRFRQSVLETQKKLQSLGVSDPQGVVNQYDAIRRANQELQQVGRRTLELRQRFSRGDPREAIAAVDAELGALAAAERPGDAFAQPGGDPALGSMDDFGMAPDPNAPAAPAEDWGFGAQARDALTQAIERRAGETLTGPAQVTATLAANFGVVSGQVARGHLAGLTWDGGAQVIINGTPVPFDALAPEDRALSLLIVRAMLCSAALHGVPLPLFVDAGGIAPLAPLLAVLATQTQVIVYGLPEPPPHAHAAVLPT